MLTSRVALASIVLMQSVRLNDSLARASMADSQRRRMVDRSGMERREKKRKTGNERKRDNAIERISFVLRNKFNETYNSQINITVIVFFLPLVA